MRALLVWLALTSSAQAQEFIDAEHALNDEDFYRLVACAAPPMDACQKQIVKWDKADLSVGITKMDRAYLGGKAKRAQAALARAIQEVNSAGSAINLRRDDKNPDIEILFLDIPRGGEIRGSGFTRLEGTPISAAGVRVFVSESSILKAVIIFTPALQIRAYESAMLEEITQGLGFLTDIGGTFYETRSIFSQSSNALTKLGKQDIMALGQHYPAR
ncbi:hypothetical protein [Planktotalea sp.]|uniref:hypothetical protein n=1 Tax=Planktotalea sp. TaxID=2029877 RepID=UPI003D6A4A42